MNVLSKAAPPAQPGVSRQLGAKCVIDLSNPVCDIVTEGFSGAEPIGRWTDGTRAELSLPVPPGNDPVLIFTFEVRAFVDGARLPQQRAIVTVNAVAAAEWSLRENIMRRRVLVIDRKSTGKSGKVRIGFDVPDCAQPSALDLGPDQRFLGIMIQRITIESAAERPPAEAMIWHYGRPVGGEAAKSFDKRIETGFWSRFITGPHVLDIGFRGYEGEVVPIVEGAIGVDLDYPGYDGRRLPFADGSQDAVFSSLGSASHASVATSSPSFRTRRSTSVASGRPRAGMTTINGFTVRPRCCRNSSPRSRRTPIACDCWRKTTTSIGTATARTCTRSAATRLSWSSRKSRPPRGAWRSNGLRTAPGGTAPCRGNGGARPLPARRRPRPSLRVRAGSRSATRHRRSGRAIRPLPRPR